MRKRHGWIGTAMILAPIVTSAGIVLLPSRAYAPYKGQLQQGVPYTFQVSSDAGNESGTAVTLIKINRQNRISDAIPVTIPRGGSEPITDTAGSNIDRVLLIVNPSLTATGQPGQATVQTSQKGVILSTDTYVGDVEIAYDTVP